MAGVRTVPLNSDLEIALRTLCLLVSSYPADASLERLTSLDYLMVHSDDVPEGPPGLHPRTPYRGGEPLARRGVLQAGIQILESRGLAARRYGANGIAFQATDRSASFLDALNSSHTADLRDRAGWAINRFADMTDPELNGFIHAHIDSWGAEFTMQSVLWDGAK